MNRYRRSTWSALLYAFLGVPLAALGFAYFYVAILAGAILSVTTVGLPWLAAGVAGARGPAVLQRRLARRLAGVTVADPERFTPAPGLIGWIRSGLSDATGWRAALYLLVHLPVALVGFFVAAMTWLYAVMFAAFPAYWWMFDRAPVSVGDFAFDTWPRAFLLGAVGVGLLVAAPWIQAAVLAPDQLLVRALLGPTRQAALRAARAAAVDQSAADLRRIERDLHDGAQAQLVALAMKLGLAREELVDGDRDAALALVDTARADARTTLTELRDLVRGIHPPALDTGLAPALHTLAGRSAIPVRLTVDLPRRPSAAIESIAYFCVAELLANAAKHSGAGHVAIDVAGEGDTVRLRVADDGRGGAVPTGGGLSGLAGRVGTVDGQLVVDSPPGGPTVVTVRLPVHA